MHVKQVDGFTVFTNKPQLVITYGSRLLVKISIFTSVIAIFSTGLQPQTTASLHHTFAAMTTKRTEVFLGDG